MIIEQFWLFSLTLALAIFSPGPSFVGVTRHLFAHGFSKTLYFAAGIALGEGVLAGLVLFGLSSFLLENDFLRISFYLLSASYLGYLGVQMIQIKDINLSKIEEKKAKFQWGKSPILKGFAIGVSNPKSMIFDAAILSNFIAEDTSLVQKTTLWLWMILLTFICFGSLTYLFSIYREKLLKYFVIFTIN